MSYMDNALRSMLPTEISISIAAKLCGRSVLAFRRDVLPHCVTRAGKVGLAALQRETGRTFDADDWFAADRALTGQRRRQTEYRRSHVA